jgi:four helix bundle protein
MATIGRFEDIKAWQKARPLVRTIHRLTCRAKCNRDFGLREQIRKTVISIMSNIAEGFARRGGKEFNRFPGIALGSTAEVQSQLHAALDLEHVREKDFREAYDAAMEVAKMIEGSMKCRKSD